MSTITEVFPIDLSRLKPLKLDPTITALTEAQKSILRSGQSFEPGKDYWVSGAKAGSGYVVAMGEAVYRNEHGEDIRV